MMIQPYLQPQQPVKRQILTVSELNRRAKGLLESQLGSVWLSGEISNLVRASSGHWYFSLKDGSAQVRCAMFRFKAQTVAFIPKEGDKVVVKAKVSLYEARGDFQLIVDFMEPAGLGDLQQKLNQLMQSLSQQGLFAPEHKKNLPTLPKRIGVITSATGAAIHDVLTVLKRRCPMVPVIIYPTQVQGAEAVPSILAAFEQAESRNECDVIILTRGGGSLEDLWCFNDEKLARRIFDCQLPIVAAIGHEVDNTIAELVADLRAATPSAAAELVVPDQQAIQQKLDIASIGLRNSLRRQLKDLNNRLQQVALRLSDPQKAILSSQILLQKTNSRLLQLTNDRIQRNKDSLQALQHRLFEQHPRVQLSTSEKALQQLKLRLKNASQSQLNQKFQQLALAARGLDNLSPLATLDRGYAIAREPTTGNVLQSVTQLEPSKTFTLMVKDGTADCRVESVTPVSNDKT